MKFHTLRLATVAGIEVKIDASWIFIFMLLSYSLYFYFRFYYPAISFLEKVFWSVLSSLLWFLSIFLHELGHSLVAKKFGYKVKEIILFIFGGMAVVQNATENPKHEFYIAIAGPVVSFTLSAIFFVLSLSVSTESPLWGVFNVLAIGNFVLGAFNLVPAFPLDGGRVLKAILWQTFGKIRAINIAYHTGIIFSYVLMLFGGLYLLKGQFVNSLWLFFLGFFINKSAKVNYEQEKIATIFKDYKVERFMKLIKPVLPETTVGQIKSQYLPFYKVKFIPAIGKDGKFYLIDTDLVYEFLDDTPVERLFKDIKCSVSPYDDIYTAYKKFLKCDEDELPVIYKNTFLGIIEKNQIESQLKKIERGLQ